MDELLAIALRISIMYVYVVAIFRISGKRDVGALSPIDFVVALIIGDLFDDLMWAEVPLSQWLVGISTILILHTLFSFAEYKSDRIYQLVTSKPTPVIRDGKFVRHGMDRERTNEQDVFSQLRLLGEDQLDEIKEANWEPDGEMSLIKKKSAEEVQKQDLDALRKVAQ